MKGNFRLLNVAMRYNPSVSLREPSSRYFGVPKYKHEGGMEQSNALNV